MLSELDAESSDRYLFDQDILPAISYSMEWIQMGLTELFAQKRFSPEALVELTRTRVWQTSNFSRFAYNSADLGGEDYWTMLTVHPKATCSPNGPLLPLANDQSKVRTDLAYVSSLYSAKRQTYEESGLNRDNPFAAGNTVLTTAGLVSYAVLDASNYGATNYTPAGTYEWEITPPVPKQLIGVRYLKKPTLPTLITDTIEFRETAFNLIVDRALTFISAKQGDQTTLNSITERDVAVLLSIFGR
jgi:hypothetical protein